VENAPKKMEEKIRGQRENIRSQGLY